jgi:hypothetical protein
MQPMQGTVDYRISEQLVELFRVNAGHTVGTEIAHRAAASERPEASPMGHGQAH